ncbi:MAG: 5-bromo-4-chloroindolyl phosphate hydrolysis family protein [Oscillospiraceae bacterium]
MKNQKPRAYIPIYAFAVSWIVCAFFIPMYTLAGLAGSAAVSAAAAVVAYYTAGFILSKRPAKAEPEPEPVKKEEPALSPEVQAIIDDGKRAMKEMGRLYSSIKNNDVRKRINELMRVSDKIVQDAVDDPSDVPQIRKFLDYYLPTTIKLLNAYDRMSDQGIEGSNLSKSMSSIEDMLDTAIDAFKKQLDSLFANQALDIETDISVMNQMLAREGLSDDDADTIIKAARSGKTE